MSNNYRAHVLSRHMLFWFCSNDSPMARTQRYRHIRDKSMRFTMISIFLIINNSSMKNEKFLQERNCSKSSQESASLIFIDWLLKHLVYIECESIKLSLGQLQDFFPRSIKIWKRECPTRDLLFTMLNIFQYYKYPLPLTFYVFVTEKLASWMSQRCFPIHLTFYAYPPTFDVSES